MTVSIKTPEEIEKMRVAGKMAAEVLEMIGDHVVPGITTGATTTSSTYKKQFQPA